MTLSRDIVEFLNASDEEFKRDVSGGGSLVIVKLLKSLYGLKQSVRNWHLSLNGFLKVQGFKPVQEVDTCVYMRGSYIDSNLFLILTHVDDLLQAHEFDVVGHQNQTGHSQGMYLLSECWM